MRKPFYGHNLDLLRSESDVHSKNVRSKNEQLLMRRNRKRLKRFVYDPTCLTERHVRKRVTEPPQPDRITEDTRK